MKSTELLIMGGTGTTADQDLLEPFLWTNGYWCAWNCAHMVRSQGHGVSGIMRLRALHHTQLRFRAVCVDLCHMSRVLVPLAPFGLIIFYLELSLPVV